MPLSFRQILSHIADFVGLAALDESRLSGVVADGRVNGFAAVDYIQSGLTEVHPARTAIERRAERILTDTEWSAMRSRLVEFGAVLRAWAGNDKQRWPR